MDPLPALARAARGALMLPRLSTQWTARSAATQWTLFARPFAATPVSHALLPWSARPGRVPKTLSPRLVKLNPRLARAEERKRERQARGMERTVLPLLATRENRAPANVKWGDFRGSLKMYYDGGESGDTAVEQTNNSASASSSATAAPPPDALSALRNELLAPNPPRSTPSGVLPGSQLPSVPISAPFFIAGLTPRETTFLESAASALGADKERMESVKRAISLENAGNREIAQFNKRRMVGLFGRREGDTGSSEVQGAFIDGAGERARQTPWKLTTRISRTIHQFIRDVFFYVAFVLLLFFSLLAPYPYSRGPHRPNRQPRFAPRALQQQR